MNKIFLVMLFAAPAQAGEWVLCDKDNKVVKVIVASYAAVIDRNDGPWIKANYGSIPKVGKGWTCNGDGVNFTPPAQKPGPK